MIQNKKEYQKVENLDETKEIQNLECKNCLQIFFFSNQNQNQNSVHKYYKGPKLKQLRKRSRLIGRGNEIKGNVKEVVQARRLDGLHSKTAMNSIEVPRRS